DASKSPKWLFIDSEDKTYTEFPEICEQLRKYIQPNNIVSGKWTKETDKFLIAAVRKLKQKELYLLPNKRKRVLLVAHSILEKHFHKTKELPRKQLIDKLKKLFGTEHSEEHGIVDYYHFSQQWLDIFQPIVNKKRKQSKKKRFVYSLNELTYNDVPLPNAQLESIYKNCPYTETIDEKVAACIISIGS